MAVRRVRDNPRSAYNGRGLSVVPRDVRVSQLNAGRDDFFPRTYTRNDRCRPVVVCSNFSYDVSSSFVRSVGRSEFGKRSLFSLFLRKIHNETCENDTLHRSIFGGGLYVFRYVRR